MIDKTRSNGYIGCADGAVYHITPLLRCFGCAISLTFSGVDINNCEKVPDYIEKVIDARLDVGKSQSI